MHADKNTKYNPITQAELYSNPNNTGCQVAIASSRLSDHKSFKHGAAITKGRRVISVGCNQNKTHPMYNRRFLHTACNKLHAEIYAILRAHTDLRGCRIFVARNTSNNILGMSRPCALCWLLIQEAGIKEIIYTSNDGNWYSEKV